MSKLQEVARAEFWKQAGVIWDVEARAVMDSISRGSGVIIEGRNGIGKTGLLIPRIEEEAAGRGHAVVRADLRKDKEPRGVTPGTVFIGDEAGALAMRTRETGGSLADLRGLLRSLDDQAVIPVMVNAGSSERFRRRTSRAFRIASLSTGLRFEILPIEPKSLPLAMVQEFLADGGVSRELVDFAGRPESSALLRPRMFAVVTGQFDELKPRDPVVDLDSLRGFLGDRDKFEKCITMCGIERPALRAVSASLGI
jgi:hypothetical protein